VFQSPALFTGILVIPIILFVFTFEALFACQADRELQPWIAKDDDQGQKMWRINQRIVKLIVELMRNHDRPESLVILASASDLLLRATDGMLVDGEACTLPQLEVTSHN
jgi:GIGANTEA protein